MFYQDFQLNNFLMKQSQSYPKLKFKDYEVNTGKPTVAVVIRAPANIKKGRKGQFFKRKN